VRIRKTCMEHMLKKFQSHRSDLTFAMLCPSKQNISSFLRGFLQYVGAARKGGGRFWEASGAGAWQCEVLANNQNI